MTNPPPSAQPDETMTGLLMETARRYVVAQSVLAVVAGLAKNAADEDARLTPDEVTDALAPFTSLEAAVPTPVPSLREQEIRVRLGEASQGPWFVSDCEGQLQVWREGALEHVVRDAAGTITGWSKPSSWKAGDLLHEADLETWDEGEDPEEDLERANARLMSNAPEDLEHLLGETALLRQLLADMVEAYNALADRKQRTEQALQQLRVEAGHTPGEVTWDEHCAAAAKSGCCREARGGRPGAGR
ncbi:hypothetical protein WKI65_43135 [Streptomyces sp. MS1.AVA.3]|uniref:hypothetical protein n=1 Tax=Streptomyces decoyicus TaxID=249567 RepID=UPI0030C14538